MPALQQPIAEAWAGTTAWCCGKVRLLTWQSGGLRCFGVVGRSGVVAPPAAPRLPSGIGCENAEPKRVLMRAVDLASHRRLCGLQAIVPWHR